MAAKWIEALTGSLEQKKQYRQSMRRIDALPEPYRSVAQGYHRYFMYYGGFLDGETLVTLIGDFVDLWERAAVDGSTVHDIVGDDPVAFGEEFANAYAGRHWIDKERSRLIETVEKAQREAAS